MASSDTNSLKLQSSSHTEAPSARWYALFVTMIAGALASIQSTALIVGLTDLGKNLHAEFLTIMWMMLSFMLAVAAICPLLGFLADSGVKGSRCFMFNFGFAIFGLGSLLAGFSQSSAKGIDLVIWRSLMGVGAAFIFNNSAPILADKFHPYNQVGLAQGLWGMSFAIGSIIGPVVGGGLLDAAGWSWIFFFNVPFCAVGCIVGFLKVKDVQVVDDPNKSAEVISWSTIIRKFDFLGAILIAGGLCCLFLAITSSIFPGGNLQGDKVVIPFAVFGALGLTAFALWQYKRQGNFPIIDFTMFHSKDFTLLVVGSVALSIGRGCLTFAFIFFFQGALGQDPLAAGISVIPQGVGAFLAGFVAGKLADSMGYRNLCVVGSFVSAIGVLGSCFIDQSTNYWGIAACLFVAGVGMGMYNSPSSALGVLCVKPSRRGSSSAIRFMISLVSQMFAIVICFKLIVGSLPLQQVMILFLFGGKFLPPDALKKFVDGFHGVMWIVFVCLILLGLTSLPLTKQALKMAQSPASSGPESGHQKVVEMTAKEMEEDAGKKQEEVDAPPRPTEASSEPNPQPAVVQDRSAIE